MKERWIVRLLVDRTEEDDIPTKWDWSIDGAEVVVLSGEKAGEVAPEPPIAGITGCARCAQPLGKPHLVACLHWPAKVHPQHVERA